jgi:hypothetical protein
MGKGAEKRDERKGCIRDRDGKEGLKSRETNRRLRTELKETKGSKNRNFGQCSHFVCSPWIKVIFSSQWTMLIGHIRRM